MTVINHFKVAFSNDCIAYNIFITNLTLPKTYQNLIMPVNPPNNACPPRKAKTAQGPKSRNIGTFETALGF